MNNFFIYNRPFPYYNNYYRNNFYNRYVPNNCVTQSPPSIQEKEKDPIISDEIPSSPDSRSHNSSDINSTVWLDLFGIKLYFDDVLILSLLYLLYKEEVKDESLFISLLLLLIS